MNEFEKSTIKWARVAVLMSGVAAFFVCLQWYEMHSGSVDTHDLATAAVKQAEASKQLAIQAGNANRLTEESIRGRIAIKNIRLQEAVTVGGKISVLVETDNVGHATAFERDGSGTEIWTSLPDGEMPINVPSKESATTREQGSGSLIVVHNGHVITEAFLNGMGKSGTRFETMFFFGKIVYETLGKEHFTEFCAYLTIFNPIAMNVPEMRATAGVKTDSRYALIQCPKWHGAD